MGKPFGKRVWDGNSPYPDPNQFYFSISKRQCMMCFSLFFSNTHFQFLTFWRPIKHMNSFLCSDLSLLDPNFLVKSCTLHMESPRSKIQVILFLLCLLDFFLFRIVYKVTKEKKSAYFNQSTLLQDLPFSRLGTNIMDQRGNNSLRWNQKGGFSLPRARPFRSSPCLSSFTSSKLCNPDCHRGSFSLFDPCSHVVTRSQPQII